MAQFRGEGLAFCNSLKKLDVICGWSLTQRVVRRVSCTCEKHVTVFYALLHHSSDRHKNFASC